MTHGLKIWPEYFSAVKEGIKTFEYRLNDRNYKVGDTLVLKEYLSESKEYTGREVLVVVTYILPIQDNYVIMSVKPMKENGICE